MPPRTTRYPVGRRLVAGCMFLMAASIALVPGCKKAEEQGGMPPVPVVVTQSVAQDVPVYFDEIGHTAGSEAVVIRPQVSGQIIDRAFEDGTDVKKGQLLFKIDPRTYEASLQQAKANLAQADAQLTLAQQNFDNVKGLENTRAVSKEDFDTRKNAVATAEAQVQRAKADVVAAQVKLDYCTITAPIDGRAGDRMVDVGNIVNDNGAQALLSIQRITPIYVDFTISEQNLGDVRKYMSQGQLKVQVWLPGETVETAHEGTLTFLDNAVNADGTVRVRATLPNEDRHLWAGQFVRVRLILTTLKNAVLVPQEATKLSQKGSYVYVIKQVEKDGQASFVPEQRLVELGQLQGTNVVVTSNLKPGEMVMTTGHMLVAIGMPVVPTPSGAKPGIPGAPGEANAPGAGATSQPAPTTAPASQPVGASAH